MPLTPPPRPPRRCRPPLALRPAGVGPSGRGARGRERRGDGVRARADSARADARAELDRRRRRTRGDTLEDALRRQHAHLHAGARRRRRERDETCPVSTGGGTRRVQLVREGRGGGSTRRRGTGHDREPAVLRRSVVGPSCRRNIERPRGGAGAFVGAAVGPAHRGGRRRGRLGLA